MRQCNQPKTKLRLTRLLAPLGALMALISAPAAAALPMAVTDARAVAEAVAASSAMPLVYAVGLAPSLAEIRGDSGGVSIFSAGAKTLGLRLQVHHWPQGEPLYWQSEGLSEPHVIAVHEGQPQWLPDVPGELATLTWSTGTLAANAVVSLELVYHGYEDVQNFTSKAAGDSGTCNIDVACPQANAWGNPVRATTLITVGSGMTRAVCSATLLNNTANDQRPLLITARHCNVTPGNAGSVNAVFNYQRSVCMGANDGNVLRDVVSRSTWLAESVQADTTLVVLNSRVPRSFNARFGDWSAVPTTPLSGVSVHHPNGDQKKISLFDGPATLNNDVRISDDGGLLGLDSFTVDAWGVRWREGTTETGSSGAGLWNQNGVLVGVLSGGSSSCSNPTGTDLFGRLAVAWDESAGIRNALDPVSGGTSRASSGQNATGALGSAGDAVDGGSGGGHFGGISLLVLTVLLGIARNRRRGWGFGNPAR